MFKNLTMLVLLIGVMMNVDAATISEDISTKNEGEAQRATQRDYSEEDVSVFDKIVQCLEEGHAEFRVVEHEAENRSNNIVEILTQKLGEEVRLSQGAKAMITLSTLHNNQIDNSYNLVVLPGNETLDLKKLASILGVKKVKLAPIEKVEEMTTCIVGTVPPFPFFSSIDLMVDQSLIERNSEIFFTPGRSDRSIFLKVEDYIRIVSPRLVNVIK